MINRELFYDKDTNTYISVEQDADAVSPRRKQSLNSALITFNNSSPDKNQFANWEKMNDYFGNAEYGDIQKLQEKALENNTVLLPVWKVGDYLMASEKHPFPSLGDACFVCGVIFEENVEPQEVVAVKRGLVKEVSEYSQWQNGQVFMVTQYDARTDIINCAGDIYGAGLSADYIISKATEYFDGPAVNISTLHGVGNKFGYEFDEETLDMVRKALSFDKRIEMHQTELLNIEQEVGNRYDR